MNVLEKHIITIVCFLVASIALGQNTSDNIAPKKMPVVNNSGSIEFSPTISADGRTLIFESDRKDKKWMLYESFLGDDGVWSKPRPINSINDKCEFVAGPNISYDANTLYYTAFIEGTSVTEDIYYSTRTAEGWSAPIKFTDKVNTDPGYEGFSSISSDERDLYYISPNEEYPYDKKSKESCFNIWVTRRDINGEWSDPKMLPETINSSCVRDPKIMADNRTLLFSKVIPGVKAKYNLYQSRLQLDGSWSEPVSLEYVNTDLNNLAPGIPASGDIMYFYSEGDIYTITIPEEFRQFFNATIHGIVSDYKTNNGLPAKIVIKDANSLETLSVLHANDNGEFSIVLNSGRDYVVEFEMEKYLSHFFHYKLEEMDKYFEEKKMVKLKSDSDLGVIVYDNSTGEPIPATITIYENNQVLSSFEIHDYESEESNLSLAYNKEFTIVASAPSYKSESISIDTNEGTPPHLRFLLDPKTVEYDFLTLDAKTKQKQDINLTLINLDNDEIIKGYSWQTFQLREGDKYEIQTAGNKGYLPVTETFTVATFPADQVGNNVEYEINMEPVGLGLTFTLEHIYFETNSAELSPSSLSELKRLLDFMVLNDNIGIEISAHTDDVGSHEYNIKLSQARASSVYNYLVSKHIDENRMKAVGYGEERPVVPNTNAENRRRNRRVEMKVTSVQP